MGYEQMEFDVTLSGDRELKDNVGIAVEFDLPPGSRLEKPAKT